MQKLVFLHTSLGHKDHSIGKLLCKPSLQQIVSVKKVTERTRFKEGECCYDQSLHSTE